MVQAFSVVLVRYLGLGALNAFLVFNLAGVLGLLMLRRALWELTEGGPGGALRLVRLLIWLPGLSFWSSAPGKDGLAFLGVCLAVYAAVDLRPRWPWLVAGVASMFLVRPHMAVVLLGAAAMAHFTEPRRRGSRGLLLPLVLLVATAVVVPYALEYAGLAGAQEVEDLTSYVEKRQSTNLGGNSSVDISAMTPGERLFTFMFRPLFVDATSVTGLVASAESLVLLLFVLAGLLAGWRCRPRPSGFALRFAVAYLLAGWVLLANVTANLGIAVRQKTMLVPALLAAGALAYATLARQRRRRASTRRPEPAVGALAPSAPTS